MKNCIETASHLRSARGFTLIELVITVAIVAVITAVALPTYLGSVRKGRRAEAVSALSALQQAQERWRANNQQYAASLTNLNPSMPSTNAITAPGQYYSLSIDASSASGYVMTAQAVNGTSQANDLQCRTLRLQLFNGAVLYGGCNGCSAPSAGNQVSDSNGCWAK